ncbi:MAG: FAD-binding oxidoreductase [Proteobacteria bacterium]|nr:FAD-binding oxidoreductase [Pseudomonadota bacterium]
MQESPGPRRKKGWMSLRVTEVIDETWDTKTFLLEDADEGSCPFDYIAGQYLTFRFDDISERAVARSYTMSSSPNQQGFAAVTIKRVPGGLVSNYFCDKVIKGSIVKARGPIGKFCFDASRCRDHLIMLGAGSGVTPFVSILRAYADTLGQPGSPKLMTLLVAYRSKEDLISWTDLEALRRLPGIQLHVSLTRQDARDEGFDEIADWFETLAKAERSHANRFTKALNEMA